jgi:chromosome segregation ATPase
METWQQMMDHQQLEMLRAQISVDEQLLKTLSDSLQTVDRHEKETKRVPEWRKKRSEDSGDNGSTSDALKGLARLRSAIEERIKFAKHRIKAAEDKIAQFSSRAAS